VNILVLNAGSSTLKFALFGDEQREAILAGTSGSRQQSPAEPRATGLIDWKAAGQKASIRFQTGSEPAQRAEALVRDYADAVAHAVQLLRQAGLVTAEGTLAGVGHRVVHGGAAFRGSIRIDAAVKADLARLAELAPLHNPPALKGIEAAEAALPGAPQVAVFDTAFHATLPPDAYLYPLPYSWYEDWGIRRFGFHGISFAYCAGRAAEMLGRDPAALRLVLCHLGNGCSATAVRGGASVATTMGFTPLEGLMMGTRSGSVDPEILVYVQRQRGLTVDQVDDALNHHSGLLGVSGLASDFREVEQAADQGNERARLALAIYANRVRAAIGALAVTLGGVDALVFTAGVGENSASLRAAACEGLECLGIHVDPAKNKACQPDADIAGPASASRVLVIHTREELLIAREVQRVLTGV
jgi:acetate kinase